MTLAHLALFLVSVASFADASVPNWMPCEVEPARSMPFCNHTLEHDVRLRDLLSRMTREEMCQQTYDKMGTIAAIPSWQGYNWNTECLHGLGGICHTVDNVTRCPTVFPAPPGLGASFNLSVAAELGRIISDEIRAYSNSNGHRSYQNRPIGVSAWGPNLNIYRDPRWGRNMEVPSEDPYHSGQYGVAYTRALQWGDDDRYVKAIGALKHYTIYSVENSGGNGKARGSSYFPIDMRDIEETYLPQFRAPVVEAKSLGYMCSYAALTNPNIESDSPTHPHSEPCCASRFFAVTKMVEEYGFEGYVQSDCGAVGNEISGEHFAANASDAAAKAIVDGRMNSNCGNGLMQNVCDAIDEGLMSVDDLIARVNRSFALLMAAGLFDPVDIQEYTKIGFDAINSPSAVASNLDAARQSFVLLKNDNNTLPFAKSRAVAVIGPFANSTSLAGNYFEDIGLGTCAGIACVRTLVNATSRYASRILHASGCVDAKCASNDGFENAVRAAEEADVVVLALGIDGTICGEGNDRMNISLPGLQYDLAELVLAAKKPTAILLFSGGLVDIGNLKLASNVAIVQAFFPGATGGTAVAETLFGEQNRFGKLPFTFYASNFTQLSDFDNMNMTDGPGRTYKYLKDDSLALWPFGWGLSYTEFEITSSSASAQSVRITSRRFDKSEREIAISVTVTVKNVGKRAGDEVVFLFKNSTPAVRLWEQTHRHRSFPSAVPRRELIGFDRVSLEPGQETEIHFNVSFEKFSTVDAFGTRHILEGAHGLIASRGHGREEVLSVDISFEEPSRKRWVLSTLEGLWGLEKEALGGGAWEF